MRPHACQYCASAVFFDDTRCGRCHSELGYWAETDTVCVLDPIKQTTAIYQSWSVPERRLRRCANSHFDACNWIVDADGSERMCSACRHNRIVPSIWKPDAMRAWRKIELAKRKFFSALHRLDLVRVIDRFGGSQSLGFQFLDDPEDGGPAVMTGHLSGLITIATKEADDAERERRRTLLGEPYRTLLGHFRHESGHYFWDRLVSDDGQETACRAVFGNHEEDYQAALARHYQTGARADWHKEFVSPYATVHPWEDFAETWAHYLHMVATLDTAFAYQLRMAPRIDRLGHSHVEEVVDPYHSNDIDELVAVWLPLTTALNALNSSMGKDDAYPFVLSEPVIAKLGFIHELIAGATRSDGSVGDLLIA